jgi:DNA ligase (NAD+)
VRGRIEHIGSRGGLDIEGLGEETAFDLVDAVGPGMLPLLATEAGLFDLTGEDLFWVGDPKKEWGPLPEKGVKISFPFKRRRKLTGKYADPEFLPLGQAAGRTQTSGWILNRRAEKLLDDLKRAKNSELWRLLVSLNIRHLGPVAAQALAREFGNIDKIKASSREEIASIRGVGQIIADSIVNWFEDPWHWEIVDRWKSAGVRFDIGPIPSGPSGPRAGRLEAEVVVLSGSIPGLSRSAATALLEAEGAVVLTSVSARVTAVVVGDGSGSKAKRARELDIAVVDSHDFSTHFGFSG